MTRDKQAAANFLKGRRNAGGRGNTLLLGSVAAGVLLGAALSTYLWRQRVRALNLLNMSPLERAEQMISNCERKLEAIEQSFADLQGAQGAS